MAHRYFTTEIIGGTGARRGCGTAFLRGAEAAHLARVLRAKPGQTLTLCDGEGTDYEAEISAVSPDEITLAILSQTPSTAEPTLFAEVFIAAAKGDKMDWAIQKSVELGASAIHPFYSENCVAKPKNEEEKAKRYNRIALEAAKQSGRGRVPTVSVPMPYAAALQKAAACAAAVMLHEKATGGLAAALKALPQTGAANPAGASPRLAILTGPEGGFSPDETEAATKAGCTLVGLGPRILRCETAPIAALAAVMALTGNLE